MFCFTDIQTYHGQLKTGATTCAQAVQFYLDQIKDQQNLNAYLEVFAEDAIESAKVLDQERFDGKSMGPLHGVVVGIKDVISYKGHALSAASKMLEIIQLSIRRLRLKDYLQRVRLLLVVKTVMNLPWAVVMKTLPLVL